MDSKTIREKYLNFFKDKGHQVIDPAPLVLEQDLTTLFTSAGMQPLVPYLKGQTHPQGKRLVNSQPCLRTQDIEEVGNNRHTTFFEMLGNWSLGEYFKKEQLTWIWQFLTEELNLPKEKLYVSVFEGDEQVPKDTESLEIWKSLGVEDSHIHFYSAKKNWWSLSGPPEQMKEGEIGGPDSEVFYQFDTEHDPKYGETCHPNCDCGRFLEIGNSVFIQYQKQNDKLVELPNKNVDFGGGLERLVAASNNNPDIFETDLLWPAIEKLSLFTNIEYGSDPKVDISFRIIVDHIRAASFLINNGIVPSNKLHGYVLRRLIRRALLKLRRLPNYQVSLISSLSSTIVASYEDSNYFDYKNNALPKIHDVIFEEAQKFDKTLALGINELRKIFNRVFGGIDPENPGSISIKGNVARIISGKDLFKIYETYGLPIELSQEIMTEWGLSFDQQTMYEAQAEARTAMEEHKELSRTTSAGMFKGGLQTQGEQETKYHTATHLLHQALRAILGDHVIQRGSNITIDRLRFDFSHPEKLTDEQIRKVEALVNAQIELDLPVSFEEMSKDEALSSGAIGAFGEKYSDQVKVYKIGEFSKEICGGPHVTHTKELGTFKITKEEASSAGVRRIYATLN